METRANHVLVGGFVLLLILGLVGFVLWLGKIKLDEEVARFRIHFEGSVTGLKEGNPVRYRGIPVGAVEGIRINPENVELVEVVIRIPIDTPIKEDTEASLEFQGITGVAYVQISGGTQAAADLVPAGGQDMAIIPSRPSQLEQVIKSAPELINRFIVLVERASKLLSESNQKSIASTLENVSILTSALAEGSGDIEKAMSDATATIAELRGTIRSLNLMAAELRGEVGDIAVNANLTLIAARRSFTALTPALTEARKAVRSVGELAQELESVVAENRRSVQDFSGTGLYDAAQLITELRTLVASVTRLTERVENDPARFFFGDTTAVGVDIK
jgi:phospholipid/cholesterol/gamma-HCH transport system substrate-binding protein